VSHFIHHASSEIYTLSLHDALPIWSSCSIENGFFYFTIALFSLFGRYTSKLPLDSDPPSQVTFECVVVSVVRFFDQQSAVIEVRSEEHTSELQSRVDLVCRLLLEKK